MEADPGGRERLHRLVDALPASELGAVERCLELFSVTVAEPWGFSSIGAQAGNSRIDCASRNAMFSSLANSIAVRATGRCSHVPMSRRVHRVGVEENRHRLDVEDKVDGRREGMAAPSSQRIR